MDPATILEQRKLLVEEAESWIGTPYHSGAMVKGVGIDCLTLITEVPRRIGLVSRVAVPYYPADWHLHSDDERYLRGMMEHCVEVPGPPQRTPQPGDFILWKFGLSYSHGAIIVDWPYVIHAWIGMKVIKANAEQTGPLVWVVENTKLKGTKRQRRFFTLKQWAT